MNYNIVTYSIYLPIIAFIMVKIGWLFYNHGEVFLLNIFEENTALVKSINNLLLIGYYLVNLGYAVFSLAYWETVESVIQIFNTLGEHLGTIIIALALLHYNNVFLLNYLVKSKTLKL